MYCSGLMILVSDMINHLRPYSRTNDDANPAVRLTSFKKFETTITIFSVLKNVMPPSENCGKTPCRKMRCVCIAPTAFNLQVGHMMEVSVCGIK